MSCVATRPVVTCDISPKDKEFIRQKMIQALKPFGFCAVEMQLEEDYDSDMEEFLRGIVPGPKKKKFRFADEEGGKLENVEFFVSDKKENVCPKESLPASRDDVSPYLGSGSSAWCDDAVDRKLYQVNLKINQVDIGISGVQDFGGRKKSISEIRKSRVTHWQNFANPRRFLMGHLLTSPSPTSDFASIPAEVKADVKKLLM